MFDLHKFYCKLLDETHLPREHYENFFFKKLNYQEEGSGETLCCNIEKEILDKYFIVDSTEFLDLFFTPYSIHYVLCKDKKIVFSKNTMDRFGNISPLNYVHALKELFYCVLNSYMISEFYKKYDGKRRGMKL